MKQNQIKELPNLEIENFENIFNIYQNPDGTYFYNLLQTIVFPPNLPSNLFTYYTIVYGDTWPFISYKVFKTPNLWWLIMIANNLHNPIKKLINGNILKIPIVSVVREVLDQLGGRNG